MYVYFIFRARTCFDTHLWYMTVNKYYTSSISSDVDVYQSDIAALAFSITRYVLACRIHIHTHMCINTPAILWHSAVLYGIDGKILVKSREWIALHPAKI